MNLAPFVLLLAHQPWIVVLPLVLFAFLDGVLGYLAARKRGEAFSWNRFADFMENSVGAHQLLWVAGTVLMVYLTGGSAAALASLIVLAGINSVVYLKVLADLKDKLAQLMGKKVDSTPVSKSPDLLH